MGKIIKIKGADYSAFKVDNNVMPTNDTLMSMLGNTLEVGQSMGHNSSKIRKSGPNQARCMIWGLDIYGFTDAFNRLEISFISGISYIICVGSSTSEGDYKMYNGTTTGSWSWGSAENCKFPISAENHILWIHLRHGDNSDFDTDTDIADIISSVKLSIY